MEKEYIEIRGPKNVQKILLYMLKIFHEICVNNDIFYILFGGSMLGAVRHKGFIPWDDDLDVSVPDYEIPKLKAIITEKYQGVFEWYDNERENYIYPFPKICLTNSVLIEHIRPPYNELGAYIDVFPVYGYPEGNEQAFFKKVKKYNNAIWSSVDYIRASHIWWKKPWVIVRVTKYPYYRIKGYKKTLLKEIRLLHGNKCDDGEFVLLQGAGWNQKGKLRKDIFYDRTLCKFEDTEAYILADYDQHLKNLYGDYMKLPPKEKRVSNHDYHLYIDKTLWKKISNSNEGLENRNG